MRDVLENGGGRKAIKKIWNQIFAGLENCRVASICWNYKLQDFRDCKLQNLQELQMSELCINCRDKKKKNAEFQYRNLMEQQKLYIKTD